jgi:tripartite-type tricarboxylate transporter receptor subunit TctC
MLDKSLFKMNWEYLGERRVLLMKTQNIIKGIFIGALCLMFTGCAADKKRAETNKSKGWRPNGAVTFIIPSNPGGGHDTAGRVFAKVVQDTTGVKLNVVNNAAGGGSVAFNTLMNAKPDGMTIGQLGLGLTTDQYTVPGCKYTPDSYRYIGIPTGDNIHLVVSTKGKFKDMDLKQFLEYCRTHKVSTACSGTWGQSDTSRYLIEQSAKVKFRRVGIKGGAKCALAVVSGDVDSALVFPAEIAGQVKAGNLKVLGQLGLKRNDFFPDVPTFKELGYDINVPSFKVIALPKNTPDEIYNGWLEIFKAVMENPETAKAYKKVNVEPMSLIGEDAYKYIMKTHHFMKKIIDTGVMKK